MCNVSDRVPYFEYPILHLTVIEPDRCIIINQYIILRTEKYYAIVRALGTTMTNSLLKNILQYCSLLRRTNWLLLFSNKGNLLSQE